MRYYGGCDVGSTYTKALILDENGKICADTTIRSKINSQASAEAAMEEAEAGIKGGRQGGALPKERMQPGGYLVQDGAMGRPLPMLLDGE